MTDIVGDLRDIDRRVRLVSIELSGSGWIDGAATPLDNPWVTERVARSGDQIEMLPVAYELPVPGRAFKNSPATYRPVSTPSAPGILRPLGLSVVLPIPEGPERHGTPGEM